MGRRATAKEVAQAAGVSKWTVMRAFTPGASITEETRETVLKVARKLNYSPNLLARSLATNLTNQVAVFVDDFGNPHKLPFLEKLTERFQAEGLIVMLININRHFDHVHALLNADQRQVDAIVLFGTSFRDETLRDKRLRRGLPPLIVLARDSQIKGVPAVTCDTKHRDGRDMRVSGEQSPTAVRASCRGRRHSPRLSGAGASSSSAGPSAGSWTSRNCQPSATAWRRGPRRCGPTWPPPPRTSASTS